MQTTVITEADLPDNLKNLWLKAMSAIEMGNHGYAVKLLQPIVKDQPSFLEGRKSLRKAQIRRDKAESRKPTSAGLKGMKVKGLVKKDPVSAVVAIEALLDGDPCNVDANQMLYDAAMRIAMPDLGAFALETIRMGHPKNTKVGHQLAEHYLDNDRPDLAADVYKKVADLDPSDLAATKGIKDATARASMMKANFEGSFRDNLANDKEAEALENSQRSGMTKEQMNTKLEEWFVKYNEDQNNINVSKRIADLFEQMEDWPSALQYYEWAYHLSDQDTALEAKVSRMRDKANEAELALMKEEIENNPDAPDLAEKQERLDSLLRARAEVQVDDAKKRVERNPTDPQLRFELGQFLYNLGDYTEAIQHLQRARNNPHIRTRAMLILGRCYTAKNMDDLGANQFEEAKKELVGMDATKKEVVYDLALLYQKMDKPDKYLENLKEIYETDYGYRDVAKRVEESYGG